MKISKQCVLAALVTLTAFAIAADTQAFWGSGGSWGSRGGWGSGGGSFGGSAGSAGSWGGSHGSYGGGPIRRLVNRIRNNVHGSHGSYGSYGSYGGYGSYGSRGSYGGGHVVSYGSHGYGSHGSGGGAIYESAPAESPSPVPYEDAPAASIGHPSYGQVVENVTDKGRLQVSVPEDAIVYVNGTLTKSTGTERHYVSRGLQSGRNYSYAVRVEFQRDGKTVTETKAAKLTAGGEANLAFASETPAATVAEDAEPTKTQLMVEVPADAKVTLAGVETQQTGEIRHFATTKLTDGNTWEGYTVRVEVERDGRTVSEEKTISLTGGSTKELVFNLDGVKLAAK